MDHSWGQSGGPAATKPRARSSTKQPAVSWRPSSAWDNEEAWSSGEVYVGGTRTGRSTTPLSRRAVSDVRGMFVAGASAFVLLASLLAWHPSSDRLTGSRLTWSNYGYWSLHDILPAAAFVAVVLGVVNALLKAGDRGAMGVFVTLRLVLVIQLGAVIASIIASASSFGAAGEANFAVLWPAWLALAGCVVALLSSLATVSQHT